jgi:Fe-Mn family superoxide dismutase
MNALLLVEIRRQHGGLDQLKSTFSAAALGLTGSGYIWFVTDGYGSTAVLPTFGTGTLLVRSRRLSAPPIGKHKPMVASQPVVGEDVEKWSSAVFKSTKSVDAYESISKMFEKKGESSTSSEAGPSSTSPGVTSPTSGTSISVPPLNPSTPSKSMHNFSIDRILNGPVNSIYGESSSPSFPSQNAKSDYEISPATDTLHPLFCVSVNEHVWMSAGYGVWGKEEYLKRFWGCLDWKTVSEEYGKFVDVEGKM